MNFFNKDSYSKQAFFKKIKYGFLKENKSFGNMQNPRPAYYIWKSQKGDFPHLFARVNQVHTCKRA